ncbi:MAG: hypothetical protein M1830_003148 [Pleopsidium flavum]|nr:MAG: hypothetical protein M1830_003148 [Pleopsidium flavum]
MATPTTENFLAEIAGILRENNGARLHDYLILEPPLPPLYNVIVSELRQAYPQGTEEKLEAKCKALLPEYDEERDEGGSWTPFILFLVQYFTFLRDVSVEHLVETHDLLKGLLNQCILALSDAAMGVVVLPTVISLSRTLARLAIGLDKRPELVAHLTRRESTMGGEEMGERITLVESSANVIREAFKKCLSERSGPSSGITQENKPEGRRIGIYPTANLCLKLFFHCRKIRNAEQIFGNIYQQSPPLTLYPASQRVTYLYYLGRYLFSNNHFYRALLALQSAYDQCHARCPKQRRLILIYLITSNIILGRFPATSLLQRPEAEGLADKFLPLCQAIAKGDLASFRTLLSLDSESADWFLSKRILLQLRNRCEVVVWRSLARRTFMLAGFHGDASNKKAPTFELADLLTLATFLEKRALLLPNHEPNNNTKNTPTPTRTHTNSIFLMPTPPTPPTQDLTTYTDPDLLLPLTPTTLLLPTTLEISSILSSLIDQGLLHGYISHKLLRFAIQGAKTKGALQAGFPNVWAVISRRADGEVPGWVREDDREGGGGGYGGRKAMVGMVVKLKGARAVGAGAEGL